MSINLKPSSAKGEMFAIFAAVLWGINYVVVKSVLKSVPESQFLFIRFGLSVVLFLGILIFSGESLKIQKQHYLPVLILGVFGVGVYNILWTFGIHRTTSSNAALLISTSPIFTGIYTTIRKEEPVSFQRWAGTFLAFLGIFLIIGARFSFNSDAFTGNLIILASALLFALYAIIAKPLLNVYSPSKLTAYAISGGLLVLIPYCLSDNRTLKMADINLQTWLSLIYIIIAGTIIAYIFWYKGIKQASPVRIILFHYLCPVISMALGPFLLGEKITLSQVIGATIVFSGLIMVKWTGWPLIKADRRSSV